MNDNIHSTMDTLSNLLGYTTSDKTHDKSDNEGLNEYQQAAQELKSYILEAGYQIPTEKDSIEETLKAFKDKFSPEALEALTDETVLQSIFYTLGDNTNSLCCWLEMNKDCRAYFGSIAGGSAFKFGLFQRKETGIWTTGSGQKVQELTEEEALVHGKEIRDALVKGARIIRSASLTSLQDYEALDDKLRTEIGEPYYNWSWFHKYYSIICNDKLSCFHSTDWQEHVLRALKIKPSDKYYARSGQISMIQNYAGWYYRQLFDVFYERFGEPRQFVRIGSSDNEKNYVPEWAKRGVVGIGWSSLGELTDYIKGESIDRKEVQDKLKELYFPNDDRSASRKAGEIVRFFKCNKNTVFVIMDGQKLIALADAVGDYFCDASTNMAHQRPVSWKNVFDSEETLPEKSEGKLTTCYQLSNEENLMFLYEKYYYAEEKELAFDNQSVHQNTTTDVQKPISFKTGYVSAFGRNRIVFGAPGTGKSYTIRKEAIELIGEGNDDDYERVTFHPDYSYANFVGTYKPVPSKDSHGNDTITYAYVPGPFMRILVKALKNSRTDNIKPFLLIIEEINRANVASVFGDVFQLLDRGSDNVSEYPINVSEDIKTYLVNALKVAPEQVDKIRIPDNMFIWATMNSADQGVYPMDTAFKRRWEFKYLGIDSSDEEIQGKFVVVGKKEKQRIEWNELRKAINDFLSAEKINEDKQLGPYFISRNIVVPSDGSSEINSEIFCEVFKNKVLMYLFDDAAKQKRVKLFEGSNMGQTRYSKICEAFDDQGIGIFHSDILRRVKIYNAETENDTYTINSESTNTNDGADN